MRTHERGEEKKIMNEICFCFFTFCCCTWFSAAHTLCSACYSSVENGDRDAFSSSHPSLSFLLFLSSFTPSFFHFFAPSRNRTMTCTRCCCVTPAHNNVSESFNSLPFANNRILSGSTGKSVCPALCALPAVYSFVFS